MYKVEITADVFLIDILFLLIYNFRTMSKYFFLLLILTASCSATTEDTQVYPIAIIGAGAGGTMAAKRATLSNRQALLFTGLKKERKRSRGHWVRKVDNIPSLAHYTRTLNQLRDETLAEIAASPFGHNLHVVDDSVLSIEKQDDTFTIYDMSGNSYKARHIILATGIMDEQPHINGTHKTILPFANKQLVAYCILCDGHRCLNKKTVVIGYSETAALNALLLHSRYSPPALTMLTNGFEPTITEETLAKLQEKNINIVKEPITAIVGDAKARILNGFTVESGNTVEAEIGFVTLGIRPNNSLALSLGAEVDEKGLVLTDENSETSVANLFVIGDLRANSLKQIYTAWQHAIDSLQEIDRRIRAKE